jgi:enediyne biosynthesis thioesterase
MSHLPAYSYRHCVSFEETNLTGNVYYVNHLRWQGRCREMFLREHAPEVIDDLAAGLRMVTTRCSCEYLEELFAFDEIVVEMRLGALAQNRVTMLFDYTRAGRMVARGEQQIACMRMAAGRLAPTPVPVPMRKALEAYAVA